MLKCLRANVFLQLLSKKVQEVTPSAEEQALVQGLCTKVSTVIENMIVTGEGEELVSTSSEVARNTVLCMFLM